MATVLLIDDMKNVRRAVAALLKRAGHHVVEADDGTAGIATLKSGASFDLVITDMLMPGNDGMDVIAQLEVMPRHPPVLAISGGGSQVPTEQALRLARLKADAVLAKPFDNAELMTEVERLLKRA